MDTEFIRLQRRRAELVVRKNPKIGARHEQPTSILFMYRVESAPSRRFREGGSIFFDFSSSAAARARLRQLPTRSLSCHPPSSVETASFGISSAVPPQSSSLWRDSAGDGRVSTRLLADREDLLAPGGGCAGKPQAKRTWIAVVSLRGRPQFRSQHAPPRSVRAVPGRRSHSVIGVRPQ